MKLAITAYLESLDGSFEGQLKKAKELGLNYISLRTIDGLKVHEIDQNEILKLKETLKKSKIKIMEIDACLNTYNCSDSKGHKEALLKLDKIAKIASELGVLNIVAYLPIYGTKVEEYDQVIKLVNAYSLITDRAKKKLLLRRKHDDLGTSITHIINGIKSKYVGLSFDPCVVALKNESVTTNYRVLKNYIQSVVTIDVDEEDNPQLIGYGKAEVLELFKRMINDEYKGYLTIDVDFNDIVLKVNQETTQKEAKGLKKLIFGSGARVNKKNEKYFLFKKRLLAKEDALITSTDAILNQVQVLKKIFK
ncbi:sugar phosphate isomerase/epimerase [Acholeplasma sp. OttesenSCG-928-E16]|nr:sugar phosphate isomerase/epimerase [Acholeplasma sp. OttesenSCG-928-E16]